MPTKDLTGRPPKTTEDRAFVLNLHTRLGLPPPRHGRPGDDGSLPAPHPSGPKPKPLTGGAQARR